MSEIEEFRRQARRWLEANAPQELRGRIGDPQAWNWGGKGDSFSAPGSRQWLESMAERGWTAPTWPQQYGGGGLTPEQASVLAEEIQRMLLPPPLTGFERSMIGGIGSRGRATSLPRLAKQYLRAEDRGIADPVLRDR